MKTYELNKVYSFSTPYGIRKEYTPCGFTSSLEELNLMAKEEEKILEDNEDYSWYLMVKIFWNHTEDNWFTELTDFICCLPYNEGIF